MRSVIVALLLISIVPPAVAGRLCVSVPASEPPSFDCRETTLSASIEPAATVRTFSWAPSRDELFLGMIAPGATSVTLPDKPARTVLAVSSSGTPEPKPWSVALRSGEFVWRWQSDARKVQRTLAIHAAPGEYEATLAMERHSNTSRRVRFPTSAPVAVALVPFPTIAGVVVDAATGGPVTAAAVTIGEGREAAVTDAAGRFSFDIDPEEWPQSMTIEHPSYASEVVLVPKARATVELLPVKLSKGAALRVLMPERHEALELELRKRTGRQDHVVVSRQKVAENATEHLFSKVASGSYVVYARGDGPLEQYATAIEIKDTREETVTLAIEPFEIVVNVRSRGVTVPDVLIDMSSPQLLWRGEVRGGSEPPRATLWQAGTFWIAATAAGRQPASVHRELSSRDAEVTIDLPQRILRGTVVESESGEPVASAAVMIEHPGGLSKVDTDATGAFIFNGIAPGSYAVRALRVGYAPSRRVQVDVSETADPDPITLRVRPSTSVRITAMTGPATAAAGATVLAFVGEALVAMVTTDSAGKAELTLPPQSEPLLFVLPQEGSFWIRRLRQSDIRHGEIIATVPAPQANLLVRTRSTGGAPEPNISLLVRVNGEMLPAEAMWYLSRAGMLFRTDGAGDAMIRRLPLGHYELWPIVSREELQLARSGLRKPAVAITLPPGDSTATLTFEKAAAATPPSRP